MRFPKSARLLRPSEFKNVFNNPVRYSRNGIVVLGRENGMSSARLGIAVAKRYVRRAHERNRIKRIVRESFRLHPVRSCGMDFVVLFRAGAEVRSSQDLRAMLDQAWDRFASQCVAC